jgi:hypothetical protein
MPWIYRMAVKIMLLALPLYIYVGFRLSTAGKFFSNVILPRYRQLITLQAHFEAHQAIQLLNRRLPLIVLSSFCSILLFTL